MARHAGRCQGSLGAVRNDVQKEASDRRPLFAGWLVAIARGATIFRGMDGIDQFDLFAAPALATLPAGLSYVTDFISHTEEAALIGEIRKLPLQPFQFGQYEGKRRVASFGSRYDFTRKLIEPATPMPDWLLPLRDRTAGHIGQPSENIPHALVTEYVTGAGIGWHRDKPMFETIVGISLGAACVFRLRRKSGAAWQRFKLGAAARSIYSMDGPARREWEHSMPGVDATRYSITFRTMTA